MLQSQDTFCPSLTDWRQLLESIYRGRKLYTYSSSRSIPLKPQDIWIVCRGLVQLSTLYPSGDEAIVGIAYASLPFGLPFTQLSTFEATALSEVVLMRLHLAEIEQSPSLAQGLFQQMSYRLRQTEALLAMSGYRRIEDRLRQLLIMLKQEMGQPTPEGMRIGVRLTHQQVASLIGTTRVTVTRLLNQFRDEGALIIDGTRHFVIPYPEVGCE